MANRKIRTIFFDFMGTCLDWHTGLMKVLPQSIPENERSKLAVRWRHDYFDYNAARNAANLPVEDIDITLRNVLDALLEKTHTEYQGLFSEELKKRCVKAWHSMPAWPEVGTAIQELKDAGYEVFVYANGSTRLQLDLCRSSGLSFHALFSSELLGVYKPAPESYEKMLELVKRAPEECVQVAAHAYDTRGAKKAGMRTIYVHRWTDDVNEDMEIVKAEHDGFLEDMRGLAEMIAKL